MLPNKEAITRHLEFLFKDAPSEYQDGRIEIAYTGANIRSLNQANYFGVDEIEEAVDFIVQKNTIEGINIYVGAALRKPDCPPFGRSSANDYYAATCAWVDIDDEEAADSAKDNYKEAPPHLVVVTGRSPHRRFQGWWKLKEPQETPEELKCTLSGLKHALNGDPSVVDAARVMRVGGTVAWPKKEGRVTELTETIGLEYSPVHKEELNNAYPPVTVKDTYTGEMKIDDGNPRNIFTGHLEVQKLLESTRETGKWNANMLLAIGSMVGRGWSNEQIRIACAPYSDGAENDGDIIEIINRTRIKFQEPEKTPTPKLIPEEEKDSSTFPLFYADDISPILQTNDFVEDVLCENQFSVIYGESNCGKTFFMLDLAMHVALGMNWRGKHVEQGGVLYAALEGGYGTQNRICAFKEHHKIHGNIPLTIIRSSIDFLDAEGDIEKLAASVVEAQKRIGDIKLIVVDTLSRAISGGDENTATDMGQMIIHADYLRALTGAHISFIHHSGKDKALGARGHSSLRAAVDTEIEISRESEKDPSQIRFVKQREMEMIDPMHFNLKRVELGHNDRMKVVSSCVVEPTDGVVKDKSVHMNDVQKFLYDSLVDAIDRGAMSKQVYGKDGPFVRCVSYDDLREVMEERGFKEVMETKNKTSAQQIKSATQTARLYLQRHGKISFDGKYIWIVKNEE